LDQATNCSQNGSLLVTPITWLRKVAARGDRGFPVATVAYYGPNERRATKVVLGFFEFEGAEPMLQKWIRDEKEKDCRYDPVIQAKLRREIERLGARSLSYQEIILGCPHEEGIDYPLGEICPECPYWAHRKRPIG
jgi:hypothetical protein